MTARLAKTFTLAIDDERIVVDRATLRWIRDQLEEQRQALTRDPGRTAAEKMATEIMESEIRAVAIMVEEELENQHPHPIPLAGREAQSVWHITSAHIEVYEAVGAALPEESRAKLEELNAAAPSTVRLLNDALERHLRNRGLLT